MAEKAILIFINILVFVLVIIDRSAIEGIPMLFILFSVLTFISLIIGLVFMIKGKNKILIYSITMMLVVIFSYILGDNAHKFNIKRMYDSGNQIVIALDKYNSNNNMFPENLSQLIPKYIAKIPNADVLGRSTFLYTKQDGGFSIRVSDTNIEFEHNTYKNDIGWGRFE